MKKLKPLLFLLLLAACDDIEFNKPLIVSDYYSIGKKGICHYTAKQEKTWVFTTVMFEDTCGKFNPGDTIYFYKIH